MHVILKRLKLILNEKDAPGAASSVREFACVCFDVLAVAAKYLPSRVLHEIVIEHDKVLSVIEIGVSVAEPWTGGDFVHRLAAFLRAAMEHANTAVCNFTGALANRQSHYAHLVSICFKRQPDAALLDAARLKKNIKIKISY